MVSLTRIFLGLLFMTLIVSGLIIFFRGGVEEYAPTGYDNSSLVQIQNKFNDLQNITNQTRQEIDAIKENANIVDKLGLYLGKGITAAKLTVGVIDTTNELVDIGVNELYGTSDYAITIKTMIPTMIFVIMFITILLHILTKSDRL